ncbi:hypothetical protein OOT46_30220, partial [Aquabacterium sp. A7-Y]|nr:hypothetical protein [Aquabacterium sp. A7-Y]
MIRSFTRTDAYLPTDSCGVGNPIYPSVGSKRETVGLGVALEGWELKLSYDSARRVPDTSGPSIQAIGVEMDAGGFGELWQSNWHRRITSQARGLVATASRGDGRLVSFSGNGQGIFSPRTPGVHDRLLSSSLGYVYYDASSGAIETYTPEGRLTHVALQGGATLTFRYSDGSTPFAVAPAPGYLIQVQDSRGRQVRFEYEKAGSTVRVKRIIGTAGEPFGMEYDAGGNLAALHWPDGKSRQFLYERADLPWALTGVIDENAKRKSTFSYDSEGRAISTERAGGVARYSTTYAQPPSRATTVEYDQQAWLVRYTHGWKVPASSELHLPNGGTSKWSIVDVGGVPRISSRSQPAGAGCSASVSEAGYDAQGNVTSRDDFNQRRTCYDYDLSRHLETVRVEGLSKAAVCSSYTGASAALPADARKISTQWHPEWQLQTKVAEPRRIVTTVYNGQPDPFDGNAVASCAPADAKLLDGKPIAVVCKRVEQATTDVDGSQGFSAPVATGVAARQWIYTYNQYGQVLTEDGPRTDVADVTRYEYYPDTTADWTQGDLKQVTNPAGQVTRFTKYNAHGQVLQQIDANGVVTSYTYDLRQRLKTMTVGTELTQYDYYPTGLLQRVTQPDASY